MYSVFENKNDLLSICHITIPNAFHKLQKYKYVFGTMHTKMVLISASILIGKLFFIAVKKICIKHSIIMLLLNHFKCQD